MASLKAEWPCVVFDLDGTLLDTRAAMLHAINATLIEEGRDRVVAEDLRDATHEGLDAMVQHALHLTGSIPNAPDLARLQVATSQAYLASAAQRVEPFAAAHALLDALRRQRVWMAVCTNQREVHARSLLAAFDFAEYFAEVVGRDTFAARKPSPLPLMWLIGRCGVRPRQTLLIGDSDVDARCALHAGARFVLMEHGYGSGDVASDHETSANFASLHATLFGE